MNLKNKLKFLPFVLLLISSACSDDSEEGISKEDNFSITGKITGAQNENVYIEAMSADGVIDVAKGVVSEDGTIDIKGNIPGMGIYNMRLGEGENKIIPLTMMPNDNLKITAEYNTFASNPTLTGTEWAKPLSDFLAMSMDFSMKQRQLEVYKQNGSTDEELMAEYVKMLSPLQDFAKSQMKKSPGNPVNIILSSALAPSSGWDNWDPKNIDLMKTVSEAYGKRFAGSPMTEAMANQVFQFEKAYNEHVNGTDVDNSPTSSSSEMGPEIISKTPEGKTIRLSDLRGKYVLIDFWASWCGPCRRENPNVVKLYNQYKNKDFTIFSVSLDKDAAAWKQAILVDGLIWPYHVSDLKQWDTPLLQSYNFNSIPHTVLVDKTGKIIARNLRGASLEQKLKELL